MRISVFHDLLPIEKQPFEVVERKGIGHPDTLADGIAESISLDYSELCRQKFGAILHHGVDKTLIIGGLAEIDWGVGVMKKPVRVVLNGRMSDRFGDHKIDFGALQRESCRRYLRQVLPHLDVDKWVDIQSYTSSSSRNPYWFSPRGLQDLPDNQAPYANDTSACTGFWPLSMVENLVMKLEKQFYDADMKAKLDFVGQDIKVLAVRDRDEIDVTVCVPFISTLIQSWDEYARKKDLVAGLIQEESDRFVGDSYQVRTYLNTEDQLVKNRNFSKGYYLVATGSALDYGEEGVVGRGNRSRGVISCNRPLSTEAVCGKNPVYHVGKVLTYISDVLATEISEAHGCQCEVVITTRNGDPLTSPHHIRVRTSEERDLGEIKETVQKNLSERNWTEEILDRRPFLPWNQGSSHDTPSPILSPIDTVLQ